MQLFAKKLGDPIAQHKRKRAGENKPTRRNYTLKPYQGLDNLIGISFEIKQPSTKGYK